MGKQKRSYSRSRNKTKYKSNYDRKQKSRTDRQSTSYIRKERYRHRYSPVQKSYTSQQSRSYSSSSSGSSSSSSSCSSSSQSISKSQSTAKRHQTPHFKFRKGQKLNHRYKIKKLMGDGTFGRVVQCEYRGAQYAVKIIKPVQRYIQSARTQRSIIKKINDRDRQDHWGIVRYIESFYHQNHFCMVFKPLGKSLYDFIKMNSYKGFPIKYVQSFFRQILQSIGFLHRIGYTHTDLKPENILLETPDYYQTSYHQYPMRNKYYLPCKDKVRIIDFGGATKYDQYHSSIINTRQYRSPQVILQCCKWDQISDVWSIGCIISELFTGELFFPTHQDEQHLAMIEKNSGKYPHWMIQKINVPSLKKLFRDGQVNEDKLEHIENVIGLKKIDEIFQGYAELTELIQRCLEIDPNRRINCMEALRHPFFKIHF